MSKELHGVRTDAPDLQPIGELEALTGAINATSLGAGQLDDLHALFIAIRKETEEFSQAHQLAGIGQYLSEEWGSLLEREFERLKEVVDNLDSGAVLHTNTHKGALNE